MALKTLLTQDHMGLEIPNCHNPWSFHRISAKLYEDISNHGEMQAITFLDNRPSFKIFMEL